MKIKLLIATGDINYAEHLSNALSEKYADTFYVSVCRTSEKLQETLAAQSFDAALFSLPMIEGAALGTIRLPMLLWDDSESAIGAWTDITRIRKYQRITAIVGDILENYAKVSTLGPCLDSEKANITAVWSPAGGVGKTTVALACASQKAASGGRVLYLNLEHFSSSPTYFSNIGKSISSVFEMLEKSEGNIQVLIRGILCNDPETGISYFCRPDNYDDMNILSVEDIASLIVACAGIADELIIDMPCICDERAKQVFAYADRVLLVTDSAETTHTKIRQFATQHSIFEYIRSKTTLVANKDASPIEPFFSEAIRLPHVRSSDAAIVFKTLSGSIFEPWAGESV